MLFVYHYLTVNNIFLFSDIYFHITILLILLNSEISVWIRGHNVSNILGKEGINTWSSSFDFDAVFFLEVIVTRALGIVSNRFPFLVMLFELNLKAVKLEQEQALVILLHCIMLCWVKISSCEKSSPRNNFLWCKFW